MHILLSEDTTEEEMSEKRDITKDTKVGNFKEYVTTAKKKNILLEIVLNEAISHNIKMIINEKVKDLPAVLRRKMSKIILTKKHCTHQMKKIEVDGS